MQAPTGVDAGHPPACDPAKAELWAPIPRAHGFYEASTHGRIRSVPRVIVQGNGKALRLRGKIRRPRTTTGGRLQLDLALAGHVETHFVHRLVLETFVGPCPPGQECCHWDGDPLNNTLGNLRWDTKRANAADMVRHGRAGRGGPRPKPRAPKKARPPRTHCSLNHRLVAPNLATPPSKPGVLLCLACRRAARYVDKRRRQGAVLDLTAVAHKRYAQIMKEATLDAA